MSISLSFLEKYILTTSDKSQLINDLIKNDPEYFEIAIIHQLNQQNPNYQLIDSLLQQFMKLNSINPSTSSLHSISQLKHRILTRKGKHLSQFYMDTLNLINVNHIKPSTLIDSPGEYPSKLDQKLFDPLMLIKSNLEENQTIKEKSILLALDSNPSPNQLRIILSSTFSPFAFMNGNKDLLPELLAKIVDLDKKEFNQLQWGNLSLHSFLTKQQLDQLIKLKPELLSCSEFLTGFIGKLLPEDVDDFIPKNQNFKDLKEFLKKLPTSQQWIYMKLLLIELDKNFKDGNYDFITFLEYIKIPKQGQLVNQDYLVRKNIIQPSSISLDPNFFYNPEEGEILQNHLIAYYRQNPKEAWDKLAEYLEPNFVQQQWMETHLFYPSPTSPQIQIPSHHLQHLKQLKILNFEKFEKLGNEINVIVKGIDKLIVKEYYINGITFFKENPNSTDEDLLKLDVSSLEPNHIQIISLNPNEMIKQHVKIDIDDGNGGIILVQIIGNDKRICCIVRNEGLRYLERISVSGHVLSIIDSQNNLVKKAKCFIDGRMYLPDDDGEFIIPFKNDGSESTKILLIKDDLVVSHDFERLKEEYVLDANWFINRESLIKGNLVKVGVRFALYLHGIQIPLSTLESGTVVNITFRDVDGIETLKSLQGFTLKDDEDLQFDFIMEENIRQIEFMSSSKIRIISKNNHLETLNCTHFLDVNAIDTTIETDIVELVKQDEKWYLDVFDKNGEKSKRKSINLHLTSSYSFKTIDVNLSSDDEGRIELGELKGIELINVDFPGGGFRTWSLVENLVDIPSKLVILENVEIKLNIGSKLKKCQYGLIKLKNGINFLDYSDKISFNDDDLCINDLEKGRYLLHLYEPIVTQVEINVIKQELAKPLKGDAKGDLKEWNCIPMKNEIWTLSPSNIVNLPLTFDTVNVVGNTIQVKLDNVNDNTRIHVLSYHFRPFDLSISKFSKPGQPFESSREIHQKYPTNIYSMMENLPDELEYVMNRMNKDIEIGNLLKKPGVLLSNWKIRDTSLTSFDLDGVASKGNVQMKKMAMMSATVAPMQEYAATGYAGDSGSGFVGNTTMYSMTMPGGKQGPIKRILPSSPTIVDVANLDFLKYPGESHFNLKPNSEGIVDIELNHVPGIVRIIACDERRTNIKTIETNHVVETKDVTQTSSWPVDSHFMERNQITCLKQGDFVNASVASVIFSISRLFEISESLVSGNVLEKLKEFKFIINWSSLSFKEKIKKYGDYSCHELDVFLKFKDEEFFKKVVKPFISNKAQKTMVDYWLLEDVQGCKSILDDISRLKQCNIVEKLMGASLVPGYNHVIQAISDQVRLKDIKAGASAEKAQFREKLFKIVMASKDEPPQAPQDVVSMQMEEQVVLPPPPSNAPMIMPAMAPAPMPMMRMTNRGRGGATFGSAKDMSRRDEAIRSIDKPYEPLESTGEWGERQYWKQPLQSWSTLIEPSSFWLDWLKQGKMFLSIDFGLALRGSFTEVMFALALIPFKLNNKNQDSVYKMTSLENGVKIIAKESCIIFHKEFSNSQVKLLPTILVSQKYFDPMQRQIFDQEIGENVDKYLDGNDLKPGKIYGCQVTITNTSALQHLLTVFRQIPEGSIPVGGTIRSKTDTQQLQPFQTILMDYQFYFPKPGKFSHYPVHVADRQNQVVAHAQPCKLFVKMEGGKVDEDLKKTWEWNAVNGSLQDLISWLNDDKNVLDPSNIDLLLWRLKEKSSFESIVEALKKRGVYNHQVWGYAVLHDKQPELSEWAKNEPWVLTNSAPYLQGESIGIIDDFQKWQREYLEYWPLVNARAHEIGKRPRVNNNEVLQTYTSFIRYLFYKPEDNYTLADHLYLIYLLLIQDKTSDALKRFNYLESLIKDGKLPEPVNEIQYDYCKAWLSFLDAKGQDPINVALPICIKYKDYPIPQWNRLFSQIKDAIDELEKLNSGKVKIVPITPASEIKTEGEVEVETTQVELDDDVNHGARERRLNQKIKLEPRLDMEVLEDAVQIQYANLTHVTLGFHPMNLEMEFSARPFAVASLGKSTNVKDNPALYVRPLYTLEVDLPPAKQLGEIKVQVPLEYLKGNVTVEASSQDLVVSRVVGQSPIVVQVLSKTGTIQAMKQEDGTLRPLSAAYCKVYANLKEGRIVFYKDGYCDLLGRFDYASLSNTSLLSKVEKFAILVSSDFGSVVREAGVPKT